MKLTRDYLEDPPVGFLLDPPEHRLFGEQPLIPRPSDLVASLDRRVEGQRSAKEALANAIYLHSLGLEACGSLDKPWHRPLFGPSVVLLIGPSGCGKTYLANALAEVIDIPFHTIAAPGHSEAGYVGKMIDCSVGKALAKCLNQSAIIFIDEIDKMRAGTAPWRDVSGEGVQQAILKLLEGESAQAQDNYSAVEFSTQRAMWILAGAFQGLDAIRKRRLAKDAVGFGSAEGSQLGPFATEDLVNFGMLRELVGRCTQIVEMEELSSEALLRAGWKLKGVFRRARALFEAHGVTLKFEKAAAELLAERALGLELGVRGLERVVMGIVQPALHRVLAANCGIGRVRITRAAVDGGDPVLEPNGDEPVYNVPWVKRLRDATKGLRPTQGLKD